MNEVVYNILRKCVESPRKVELKISEYFGCTTYYVYVSEVMVVSIFKDGQSLEGNNLTLTDNECRRILRGMEHVEAMRIRNL